MNTTSRLKWRGNPPSDLLVIHIQELDILYTFNQKTSYLYQKPLQKTSIKMPFEQPVVEQQIQSEAPMSSENVGIEMQQPKPVAAMGTETNLRGGESAGCECCGCGCGESCC
ncbi:hypothetical protein sscle_14g101510 [Sclerotinia sclerotiorum 1980 UF-70]|uniref:Uncharacterized protein n=2 Tax=Sclerotinia sclerotiorum (strain ATCC 18683 / 1980 / Ss-1) TaxID=665079 RepID=A0A1D9QKH4_SCLS1|nr:hypothetical protein sscle_14g101510 [Sclerotinia sclerotiorum 1980 UF-70]